MLQRLLLPVQNVDWARVRELTLRELIIGIRGKEWRRLCGGLTGLFMLASLVVAARPEQLTRNRHPIHADPWLAGWAILATCAFWWGLSAWSVRRLSREAKTGALTDLWLTGCDIRELALVRTFSITLFGVLLAACLLPAALLGSAAFGKPPLNALRFCSSLAMTGMVAASIAQTSAPLPGRRPTSILGPLWSMIWVCGGLARLFPRPFGWLYGVRLFIVQNNPVSAAVYAMGYQERRWPLAIAVTVTGLVLWLWWSLRSFAVHWSPEWNPEPEKPAFVSARICTRREWAPDGWTGEEPRLSGAGAAALAWWERRTGPRVRLNPLWAIVAGTVGFLCMALSLVKPGIAVGQVTFALTLWAACVLAAVNAGAAAVSEREKHRWIDLNLTGLSADEWLAAKLRSAWNDARLPMGVALVAILLTLVAPRGVGWSWVAWDCAALLLAPVAACAVGAVIGMHSRDLGEAQNRTGWGWAGAPLLVLLLSLTPIGTAWLAVLFPFLTAFPMGEQQTSGVPWAALGLNGALAYGAWRLLRARWWDWALAEN